MIYKIIGTLSGFFIGALAVLLLIIVLAARLLIVSIFGCWAWNLVLPKLFGLPAVTYWQFFGLNVITSALFGNPFQIKLGDDK